MTWTIISAILAAGGLVLVEWLKTRNANQKALDLKNKALEEQAAKKRSEEEAADAELAIEVIASGDAGRVIGFLRDSWGAGGGDAAAVPAAPVAKPPST